MTKSVWEHTNLDLGKAHFAIVADMSSILRIPSSQSRTPSKSPSTKTPSQRLTKYHKPQHDAQPNPQPPNTCPAYHGPRLLLFITFKLLA